MKKTAKYGGISARKAVSLWRIAVFACIDNFNEEMCDQEWERRFEKFRIRLAKIKEFKR